MSFCRRSRRSWSNKLKTAFISSWNCGSMMQAAGTCILHASLVECHVWMLGCLHMFVMLHEQLCWIISVAVTRNLICAILWKLVGFVCLQEDHV
jgi:hypothetical protein